MRRSILALVLFAAAFAAGPVRAATIGGEVFGAFNTHAMEEFNDVLSAVNDSAGTSFEDISSGFGGGLGARLWINANWMLSAVWEPLFVKTEDSGVDIDVGANTLQLTAAYFFPTTSETKLGLGVGLGFYLLSGEISGPGGSFDIEGNALGFHVMALAERTVSPGFSVHGAAGYRIATIEDTEIGGESTDGETDYSGLMLRAGLAFYLPER